MKSKLLFTIFFLAAVGYGVWKWRDRLLDQPTPSTSGPASAAADATEDAAGPGAAGPVTGTATVEILEPEAAVPDLPPAGQAGLTDGILGIDVSEYAGYAGLIAANGGLEPSENSYFFQKHGFKVRLKLSEEDLWGDLNAGKIAVSATTVDVLAAYSRQMQVVVPALIGFSRGADGVIVRRDLRRINDLRGQTLVTAQFSEADFFIRYLAQEAQLPVSPLRPGARPRADALNLAYASDAFAAGDAFQEDLLGGGRQFAGCVTWAPKTTEIVEASGGRAHQLVSNKNLLIVADILVVNRAFAKAHPEIVTGLVDGLLAGNRLVRDAPEAHLDTVARAFGWTREETREEMGRIHFANWPENQAFFSGAIDAAGSYGGIYQSALFAYGEMVPQDVPAERFLDLQLEPLAAAYADQRASITPLRSGTASPLEDNPLLTKNIRFYFAPNSYELVDEHQNDADLQDLKRLLQVSPGSTLLLRGHVDNALVEEFRRKGGESLVRKMALASVELSKNRATTIRRHLIDRFAIDPDRLEAVGRGWEEPAGSDPAENRRVEIQWFTLE